MSLVLDECLIEEMDCAYNAFNVILQHEFMLICSFRLFLMFNNSRREFVVARLYFLAMTCLLEYVTFNLNDRITPRDLVLLVFPCQLELVFL